MENARLETVFHDHSQVVAGDLYPNLPYRLMEHHLDDILSFCVSAGASDVKIYTGMPIKIKVSGKTVDVTDRALSNVEVADFVTRLYRGSNGVTQLSSGIDIDVPYEVRPDRVTRYRFRVSMTAMHYDGQKAYRITLRTLASLPPSTDDMQVPQAIIDGFNPSNGLVLVTGPTGSGKSTLLAGVVRHLLEEEGGNHDILTYEAPIEFIYDEVNKDPSSIISQSEVPGDIKSFSLGVRNALRNNPDIILVGEARDPETLTAAVEASLTGHVVYSTIHSNNVSGTIKRILIGAGESGVITATDIIDSLRMIVSQRLLQKPGGGRTAIREYFVFTQKHRDILIMTNPGEVPKVVADMLLEDGVTFEAAAKEALKNGLIFERDYLKIVNESRGEEV